MSATIKLVEPGSPAARAGISAGETLMLINGSRITDVLDYKFHSYDRSVELTLSDGGRKTRKIRIKKGEGQDLGLEFESYLMDEVKPCGNHCVFCFVDQLPRGMRETLYFKDDDARLSFLLGNYITLTNLTESEIKRITDMRISPINISVHTTNPALRSIMLGNKRGGEGLATMRRFADAGIMMNCQIVLCPGLNDGAELDRSMADLAAMHPQVSSVSIVPVGLTKYREKLYKIRPFDGALAAETIAKVDKFGRKCLKQYGSRIFFCADELYLKAGLQIPGSDYYEDYPQLENGVGMLSLFEEQFLLALEDVEPAGAYRSFSIATGMAAAPTIARLVDLARIKCDNIDCKVYPIKNKFFGEHVDVAGLVTGGDLIDGLSGKDMGEKLLIPASMLRHGGDMFLDDVTLEQATERLGVPVVPVGAGGDDFAEALFEDRG